VRQVLRLQIPGFERRDAYSRYLAENGLRAAIADRLAKRSLHDETAGAKERPPPRKRWRLLGPNFSQDEVGTGGPTNPDRPP
jgi:hypothetical protein